MHRAEIGVHIVCSWLTVSILKALISYCIAENFQGKKLSRISRFCGDLRKFSSQNLGAWHLTQVVTMYGIKAIDSFLVWGANFGYTS